MSAFQLSSVYGKVFPTIMCATTSLPLPDEGAGELVDAMEGAVKDAETEADDVTTVDEGADEVRDASEEEAKEEGDGMDDGV